MLLYSSEIDVKECIKAFRNFFLLLDPLESPLHQDRLLRYAGSEASLHARIRQVLEFLLDRQYKW